MNYATIRANDELPGEILTLSIIPAEYDGEYGYAIAASNGDDIAHYTQHTHIRHLFFLRSSRCSHSRDGARENNSLYPLDTLSMIGYHCIMMIERLTTEATMSKRHKITLTNDFHNTQITVLSEYDSASETWYHIQKNIFCYSASDYPTKAQKAKYRRIKNALCGSDDCQCGTVR